MSKWGLTEKGFRRKTYNECLQDRIDRARETYGINIDLSETSFLGTFIRNAAWDEARLWEELEDIYLSAFVKYAEGTSLDNVAEYVTISRNPATKSRGTAIFHGEVSTKIPKGFKIRDESQEKVFETTAAGVIDETGKVELPIISVAAGKNTNANKGELTEIINPLKGLDAVTNSETAGGKDAETDEEFRGRYERSHARGGGSTTDAILAALLDLETIVDAEVKDNVTMQTVDGVPPKSIAAYVFGGEDEEIAETILKSKAAGIQAFGETYVEVEDSQGVMQKIGFTRAKAIDVYVRLAISKEEGYKGDDVVKRAIINYVGGQDDDGIEYRGLGLGEDVRHARVVSAAVCLGGISDIKVELSYDGKEYVESNLEVDRLEVARTSMDKVVINHV